jgi:Transposase
MTCFVGLDVSQKMTAVCVIDNAGRRCPTVPEQINILVRRHAGDDARIGIETGAMTPWLVHELRTLGREAICLDARHARAALEMQINKTDQNDAEGLAQIVRTGWYRSVHVKSFDSHRARALLGARTQLIGMTTRLSNHIRGVLKTFGLLPGAMRGLPFDRKVEALLGAPFADFLCALADGPFGFRILLTLRADYFNLDESLQQLRSRLWADGQDAVFRLRRMSPEALAEAAREPLALAGFRDRPQVEALIQAIQRDVSDREGDLALVQMALHSVWRRHKTQSEDFLQAYTEVRGVSGALAYEAEKVRGKLSDAQKALLFPILARPIRRGELGGATRRMAQRDEFDAEKQKLIAHLSSEEGGRLLLAGERSVEIAHEALITQWPWLRTEGQKFGLDIDELARLMEKAKAWVKEAVEKRPKYLTTGAELETFSALAERHKDWLSNKEHEFVDGSNEAYEAEEKRKCARFWKWVI